MTRSVRLLFILIAIPSCGGPSSPAPAVTPSPSIDVPPLDAAAPAPPTATAPKLDATCTTNDDCDAVFTADDCCHQCRPRIANKSWKRDIDAFCAKDENRGKCEPMGCSWGYSKPRCEKGLCK